MVRGAARRCGEFFRDAIPAPDQEPATVHFSGDKVARIVSLSDNTERQEYQLAPQLITNLSDRSREQRKLVRFSEMPPALVHAVVSAEDKHFF